MKVVSHSVRYNMISESLLLFSKNETFYLSDKKRLKKILLLLEEIMSKLRKDIVNCKEYYKSCSKIFICSSHIIALEIDYTNNNYQNSKQYCAMSETKKLMSNLNELVIWYLNYHKFIRKDFRKESDYERLMNSFIKTYEKFKEYFKKHCHYNLPNLEAVNE